MLRQFCRVIWPDSAVNVRLPSLSKVPRKTVLLLGWGGARPRNLKRLQDWYSDDKGLAVLSFIMPLWIPGMARHTLVEELSETLRRVATGSSAVLVHSYSNNGAWVLAELLQTRRFSFSKIILDSAPWFIYEPVPVADEARLLSKVVTSVLTNGQVHHPILTPLVVMPLLYVACSISRLLQKLQDSFVFQDFSFRPFVPDLISLSKFLRDEMPRESPVLMLFSKEDALIPPEIVRSFMPHLERRGVPLVAHEYQTSPHTAPFFTHTEDYKKRVEKHFEI